MNCGTVFSFYNAYDNDYYHFEDNYCDDWYHDYDYGDNDDHSDGS